MDIPKEGQDHLLRPPLAVSQTAIGGLHVTLKETSVGLQTKKRGNGLEAGRQGDHALTAQNHRLLQAHYSSRYRYGECSLKEFCYEKSNQCLLRRPAF